MKKIYALSIACMALCPLVSFAQNNIITTFAGTGSAGSTGDGGPATAAAMHPERIAIDAAGNKYISDGTNNCIRKVNTMGIVTTVAGNGTLGYSGDGGQATAAQLKNPIGVAVDAAGNIYIADQNNYRIRKVNTSGIITTIAGVGTNVYSGDGGPATAASIKQVGGVAVDGAGNIYIADMSHRIRKISTSGIITTVAGTGVSGFSGDGGAAATAQLNQPWDVAVDALNNIYVVDMGNNRVRKINPSGTISTLAGNGTTTYTGDGGAATAAGLNYPQGLVIDALGNVFVGDRMNNALREILVTGIIKTVAGTGVGGFSGDGGPANLAMIASPTGVAIDPAGYLYIVDEGNARVRKFANGADHTADSFSVFVTNGCTGANFSIITNSYTAGSSIKTYFGDGATNSSAITPGFSGPGGSATFNHGYPNSGSYTVKHVLMHGTTPVDSISYTHMYVLCNVLSVKYYHDFNSNCVYETSIDKPVLHPVKLEIDSNGVAVDTITTGGGMFYNAYGNPGDIYTAKIITDPAGLIAACPSTGIVYDTIQPAASPLAVHNIGFTCSSSTTFDLGVIGSTSTGRHTHYADVLVQNKYCSPQTGTLTINVSSRYSFSGANIAPAGTTGSTYTWNLGGLSAAQPATFVHLHVEASPWYMMGDTTNTQFIINPNTGDADTTNNESNETDTASGSWDPNYIAVSPNGCIPSAVTELQYSIGFENMGNDTAYNIYILDTLSADLDVSSLKVLGASANMMLMKIQNGSQTILKFDFPNIMLPDSSHHDVCHGLVVYTIKTKAGLPDGRHIANRAGIYFDFNPVVMTNSSDNTINCPDKTYVPDIRKGKVVVYPNPATNELVIKTENDAYSSFVITNTIGQVMMTQPMTSAETRLQITHLPAGMYYITLTGENGTKVQKFVKK